MVDHFDESVIELFPGDTEVAVGLLQQRIEAQIDRHRLAGVDSLEQAHRGVVALAVAVVQPHAVIGLRKHQRAGHGPAGVDLLRERGVGQVVDGGDQARDQELRLQPGAGVAANERADRVKCGGVAVVEQGQRFGDLLGLDRDIFDGKTLARVNVLGRDRRRVGDGDRRTLGGRRGITRIKAPGQSSQDDEGDEDGGGQPGARS
jgi:hypothetical protein